MKTADFLPALIIISGCAFAPAAAAATAYISDNLTVPLRSGPTTGHRILHRGLPSGTQLTILARDDDSDFVQIRTKAGTEGWLRSQYLSDEPIARDRLVVANREAGNLREQVAQQRQQIDALSKKGAAADESNSGLRRRVSGLEQELAEIKRISASALELSETNLELTELNGRLRGEVDDLLATISSLEDNVQERWLLIGGGLVLAGLLGGIAVKSRPRRSAWN